MRAVGSVTERLTEVSAQLAEMNAYMALALRPDDVARTLLSGLNSVELCIAKIAVAIPGITSWGLTDSNTSRYIADAMTSFVNELSAIFVDLFIPVGFEEDPDSLMGSVNNYIRAMVQSLSNPLAAVLATHRTVLTETLSQIKGILYNDVSGKDRGLINQYADRIERVVKSLFLGDADLNIGGLILYAIEEAIPAIEMELVYLRKMKRAIRKGVDSAANGELPEVIRPREVNAAVANKLCCASNALVRVESILKRDNVLDRQAWAEARTCVCDAKEIVFSGQFDREFLEFHAGNMFGLTAAEFQHLYEGRALPHVGVQFERLKLEIYTRAFEDVDRSTRTLHNNILHILDVLDQLAETRLGDILALLVGLLRRQIDAVRADLEAQAQGFSGYHDAMVEERERRRFYEENRATVPPSRMDAAAATANGGGRVAYADGFGREVRSGDPGAAFGPPQVDLFAYVSAQATAYVVLEALCYIMRQSEKTFSFLNTAMRQESRIIQAIRNFVKDVRTECPNALGGGDVVAAVSSYVRALDDRVAGRTLSNEDVMRKGQHAIRKIEEYEKFLHCFKKQLAFGNETLLAVITSLAGTLAAYRMARAIVQQIRTLIRLYPQLKEMIKTLDLARLLGLEGFQLNALDTIVMALQCLILRCDNPFLSDLMSSAVRQYQNEYAKRRSPAITMNAIDEVPKSGLVAVILRRVQALLRLIELLQRLSSLNIRELCAIKTPATARPNVSMEDVRKLQAGLDNLVVDIRGDLWHPMTARHGVSRQADGTIR